MEDSITVGKIVKPQGIKGELKVEPYTDDFNRFKKLKEVYIEDVRYKVTGAKITCDSVFLALDGIYDRNTAETFRNKLVKIERVNAVKLKENAFFIDDIVGSKLLLDSGKEIGNIVEVVPNKTDIIVVQTPDGIMRFPFLKDLLVSFNGKEKVLTVSAKRLGEVCVYEN